MKFSEISSKSSSDLKSKLYALKKQLFELKIKNKIGQLTNPLSIRMIRKEIAVVSTAISKKQGE